MLCVCPAVCTDFSGNGLGPLSPASAPVRETLNGEYVSEVVHPLDEIGKWQRLVEGSIIRSPPAFSIHNCVTMLCESGIAPLAAMKIVGRTGCQTTSNICTHVKKELLKKATVDHEGIRKKIAGKE